MSLRQDVLKVVREKGSLTSTAIEAIVNCGSKYSEGSISATLSLLFSNGSLRREIPFGGKRYEYRIHPDFKNEAVNPTESKQRSFREYWNKDGVLLAVKILQDTQEEVSAEDIDVLREVMLEAFNQGRSK